MSDFRVKYGYALGPEGTYASTSAQTLITPGDTTPDVSTGVLFYTLNTSATTITYFDVVGAGGINGVSTHQGKLITIFFRDALTSLTASSVFNLLGNEAAIPAGTISEFLFHNSGWYETSRNLPSATGSVEAYTVGGTQNALNVAGVSVAIILATGATTITGLSGGVAGQTVTIMKNALAAGTAVTITGAANFWLAGTTSFVMNDSATYTFTSDVAPRFRQNAGVATP